MLFFRGWGFLLIPAFFLVGFVVATVLVFIVGPIPAAVIGGLLGGGLMWWAGTRLNDPTKDQVLVDAKTGGQVTLTKRHTLMFIPVQYYSALIFAGMILFAQIAGA